MDLGTETPLTLSEAALIVPRLSGKPAKVRTLYKWARQGVRGISLETAMIGGRLVTSRQALDRFFSQLVSIRQYRIDANRETNLDRRSVCHSAGHLAAVERLRRDHKI